MTALDRTIQLQQQGLSEQDIINSLRQEGFSMKDINDSLNQAKIKSAVSQSPEQVYESYQQDSQYPVPGSEYPQSETQEQYNYPVPTEQAYQDYSGQQQNYYQNPGVGSTETITDIAEQVVNEKIQELTKNMNKMNQTNKDLQRESQEIKDRIKRIEDNIDNIQRAIIGKIGEFGESTKMVQKDLENIHRTMSKMMNPLIDNYNELKKLNSKK